MVDNYQAELSEQISSLFNMVASCLSRQNAHLQDVNKLSQSRIEAHNKVSTVLFFGFVKINEQFLVFKINEQFLVTVFANLFFQAILEMKKKVRASRDIYSSHLEELQNVVRLHKANSNACLEEVSALTTSSACSIDEACLC